MALVPRHRRRCHLGISDQRLPRQISSTFGRLHRGVHDRSVLLPDHHAARAVGGAQQRRSGVSELRANYRWE